MSTRVQLEIFEGPLDLLLHLIKSNEASIADIPIAAITEQYLATLDLMERLNLDVAGEFLVMAATLIHIKSRMLLPAGDDDIDEDEGVDPREELIRRLMEYQRFKDAAAELQTRDVLARDVFARSTAAMEESEPRGFGAVSVFDLISAMRRVLERLPQEDAHDVTLEKITVREKMSALLERLRLSGRVSFESLFEAMTSRFEVIVTFLAMLELVKVRAIMIFQDERTGPIIIELAAAVDSGQDGIAGNGAGEEPHGA